jgi:hypothetical protein
MTEECVRHQWTRSHLLLAGFSEPISSTLKMEAIYSSETSVVTQPTTRRHIPEDDTLLYSYRLGTSNLIYLVAIFFLRMQHFMFFHV